MRKKFLLTTIVILMLSCAVATSFAIDNNYISEMNAKSQFEMDVVTPNSMYIPLVLPQLVAVNDKYAAAVSASEIAVYSNGDYFKMPTIVSDGFVPKSVAIVGDNLLVMYENSASQHTYLNMWNMSTKQVVDADFSLILGEDKEALRIDEDGSNFYIHNTGNELIEMSVTDGKILSSKVKISSVTMSKAALFDMSDGHLYIYNSNAVCIVQNDIPTIIEKAGITRFKAITDGIMYVISGEIHFYSTKTATDVMPLAVDNANSCYAYGGSIYYCDTVGAKVRVLSLGSAIVDSGKYYGDSGDAIGRYSAPQDVVASGGNVYVADTNNNRISVLNTESNTTAVASLGGVKPQKIAVNGNNIAIYDGNVIGIYKYSTGQMTLSTAVPMDGNVIDIAYHYDKLIALTDVGNVYHLTTSAVKLYENPLAKRIVANSNNNFIYIFTDKLVKFNMKTLAEEVSYEFDSVDISNISNFVIDYSGGAYCLSKGGQTLDKYLRKNGAYVHANTYDMDRLSANCSMTMDMQTGDIYIIDTYMHKLARIGGAGIGAVSFDDIGYDHAPSAQWQVVEAGAVMADTYLFTAPNNDEAVEDILAGNVFLVYTYAEYNGEQFAYGIIRGGNDKLCYIKSSQLKMYSKVEYLDNHPTMIAVFSVGATIREFPMRSAKVLVSAKRPIELKLLNNVAGEYNNHVWQWYKVTCKAEDGAIIVGYVQKDDVYYTSAITPPKNRVFLKVQTNELGKTVKLYKEPNAEAEVLVENISDGEKVLLGAETFDNSAEFTKVSYNNTVGYIYTAYLLQSGLTSGQVTTIVVSVVCVVIFIVLVVLLALRKKLFKKSTSKVAK